MGLLRVTIHESTEVTAISAKLHVQIEGETFVMGNAALERAREVRDFVSQLQAGGLEASAIQVRGVSLSNASGLLTKNQKVEFSLVVEVKPEQLPTILGIVSAQKNIRLQQVEWVFDEFEASIPLAAQAMQKARRKADAIAQAAGQHIVGVHSASDSWDMPTVNVNLQAMPTATLQRARQANLDLGVEYRATQILQVGLTVDFTLE